jgi:hypothetical protein
MDGGHGLFALSTRRFFEATELGMSSQPLRCVFVTLAPLLSAILAEALSRRIELRLLPQLDERDQLAQRLVALSPDLVVIGLGPGESDDIGAPLLSRLPNSRILLISSAADYAYVHQMRPHRQVLFDFSPDTLLEALLGPPDTEIEPDSSRM